MKNQSRNQKGATLLSPRLQPYFQNYALYHKTQGNKLTHYLGIPLILVSTLGLLGHWIIANGLTGSEYLRLDGGTLLLCLGLLWYVYLDWKIGIPFVLVTTGLYFLGRAIPTPINVVFFILGWILQGIGHAYYEKKSPAFSTNLLHLLTGPIWIFARVVGYR